MGQRIKFFCGVSCTGEEEHRRYDGKSEGGEFFHVAFTLTVLGLARINAVYPISK